jgi:hemerythrin-like domain-containing protein/quercetin dioxygenase-like cupin family protein
MTSCCEWLLAEHRKTEALLQALREAVQGKPDFDRARALYDQLARELAMHYALEEKALFPVLSQYRPMILMEVEHEDLLEAQHRLQAALTAGAATDLQNACRTFAEKLEAHILEEERGVFPLADEVLEPEEKALVARKLKETAARLAMGDPPPLERTPPQCRVVETTLFEPLEKPLAIELLSRAEQTEVQQIRIRAGQGLKPHWAAQYQQMFVLRGCLRFTGMNGLEQRLAPGTMVELSPRYPFSLEAQTDSVLLAVKTWPRPYFTRQPPG